MKDGGEKGETGEGELFGVVYQHLRDIGYGEKCMVAAMRKRTMKKVFRLSSCCFNLSISSSCSAIADC